MKAKDGHLEPHPVHGTGDALYIRKLIALRKTVSPKAVYFENIREEIKHVMGRVKAAGGEAELVELLKKEFPDEDWTIV